MVDGADGEDDEDEDEECSDPNDSADEANVDKPKAPTVQNMYSPAGKHVGDISLVDNCMGVNMCVFRKEHKCRFMVQAHRVTNSAMIATWLQQG